MEPKCFWHQCGIYGLKTIAVYECEMHDGTWKDPNKYIHKSWRHHLIQVHDNCEPPERVYKLQSHFVMNPSAETTSTLNPSLTSRRSSII